MASHVLITAASFNFIRLFTENVVYFDYFCSNFFELVFREHHADFGTGRDDDGRVSADLLVSDDESDVSLRLSVQQFGQVSQHLTFSLAKTLELKTQQTQELQAMPIYP